jgi:glycosyltransferase involved in cell wall biosynthesis
MRVTFVLPGYARKPIGGIRVVYNYANHLVARGHKVTVAHVAFFRRYPRMADGRPRAQTRELLGGARDILYGRPIGVSWQQVDAAVELSYIPVIADRFIDDTDAVVATAWQTADRVAGLSSAKGRKCYLIQHHETWSGRAERVDETWRLPLRKIFIAPWLEQRALEMGLDDVRRVSGAIDLDRFRVVRPIEARPHRVVMLHSGWSWKGADEGIAALEIARRSVPDLEAVIFGTAPRPADLPRWIEYAQDPRQDELVDEIYNGSSVYLCPSHAEGWHLPPAEAMGCGCAVVSTDIDGVRDYAIDDRTALLSRVRDPEALARNLVRVLEDDTLRLRLARTANAEIQRFRWENSTEELERALFDLVPAV